MPGNTSYHLPIHNDALHSVASVSIVLVNCGDVSNFLVKHEIKATAFKHGNMVYYMYILFGICTCNRRKKQFKF